MCTIIVSLAGCTVKNENWSWSFSRLWWYGSTLCRMKSQSMLLVVVLQRLCHYFCQKTCDRSLVSHDREGAGCSQPLEGTDLNCQRMQFAARKLKSKCVHLQIIDSIFLIKKYGVFVLSNLKKKPFGFQIFRSELHTFTFN